MVSIAPVLLGAASHSSEASARIQMRRQHAGVALFSPGKDHRVTATRMVGVISAPGPLPGSVVAELRMIGVDQADAGNAKGTDRRTRLVRIVRALADNTLLSRM